MCVGSVDLFNSLSLNRFTVHKWDKILGDKQWLKLLDNKNNAATG